MQENFEYIIDPETEKYRQTQRRNQVLKNY